MKNTTGEQKTKYYQNLGDADDNGSTVFLWSLHTQFEDETDAFGFYDWQKHGCKLSNKKSSDLPFSHFRIVYLCIFW